MSSSRPYLIRAIYDWLVDDQLTPHLLVDATIAGVVVPKSYVQDGRITLNIAPAAVRDLAISNHDIQFNARFSGVEHHLSIPVFAVESIYALEDHQRGIWFGTDEVGKEGEEGPERGGRTNGQSGHGSRRPPHLKIVK